MTCPNETDRFMVSSSIAHLNYPVGLLTSDEIVMAGATGSSGIDNISFYLHTNNNTGCDYWSLSPSSFSTYSSVEEVSSRGRLASDNVSYSSGLRPAVSLKPGTEFVEGGDGTPTKPYVVKYE